MLCGSGPGGTSSLFLLIAARWCRALADAEIGSDVFARVSGKPPGPRSGADDWSEPNDGEIDPGVFWQCA
jgi:hypothetical protein